MCNNRQTALTAENRVSWGPLSVCTPSLLPRSTPLSSPTVTAGEASQGVCTSLLSSRSGVTAAFTSVTLHCHELPVAAGGSAQLCTRQQGLCRPRHPCSAAHPTLSGAIAFIPVTSLGELSRSGVQPSGMGWRPYKRPRQPPPPPPREDAGRRHHL